MKRVLVLALALVSVLLAALVAPVLLDDPGYVAIDIGEWRLEMALLTLVLLVFLTWLALSLLVALLRLPGRVVRKTREMGARRQMEQGLLALSEGDWEFAERCLAKSLDKRRSTAGLLAAAHAAQGRSDRQSRDRWLKLADGRFGRRRFITGLARARLMIEEGQHLEARLALEDLHLSRPKHAGVLRLLLQCYQDQGLWKQVRQLAPALGRAGMLTRDRVHDLESFAATRQLEEARDSAELEQAFQSLPRKLRQSRQVLLAQARRAQALGDPMLARPGLEKLLAKDLDDEALALFCRGDPNDRASRLARCEKWLAAQPEHAALLKTTGLLYLEDHQYERAQGCLERAERIKPDSELYAALGRLYDRSGELEAAARCYRNALRGRLESAAPLPPPGQVLKRDDSGN